MTTHVRSSMYYIMLLLYDIVIVTLRFSHGFSTKSIGYSTMCIGAHRVWLRNCTNTVRIVINTLTVKEFRVLCKFEMFELSCQIEAKKRG